MAITATYANNGHVVKDAYIRVDRIWGSKVEGWNAWVAVYANEGDTQHVDMVHVATPYVENRNPFKLLYGQIEKLPYVSIKVENANFDTPAPGRPVVEEEPRAVKTKEEVREIATAAFETVYADVLLDVAKTVNTTPVVDTPVKKERKKREKK